MKTELIRAVNAYLAAEDLQRERMPYETALAMVQLKRAVAEEVTFYLNREKELALEYAQVNENGELRMSQNGGFLFREPGKAGEYNARRQELGAVAAEVEWTERTVPAPERITPAMLEALEGFLAFVEGKEGRTP